MKLHHTAAARRIFMLLVGLLLLSGANAAVRKDSIEVSGRVKDILTGKDVGAGLVMVYNEADSLVLTDSLRGRHKESIGAWSYEVDGGFRFKLPHGGKYKITFIVDGYNETPQDLVIPDRKYNKFTTEWYKNFTLIKKPREHTLKETTITATRIKMVVKGDTVEYDADAFNLAEGSMLDKLIEAMPGMTLNENGEIFHNGRKVESLLVNGKKFFGDDPTVALTNLPAYTVKKVKVYKKDSDDAYLIKDSLTRESKKKLVVDVNLKKQYSKGWMSNTDVAYGSQDRYSARMMAMYFSDKWKFMGWGNLNNLDQQGFANMNGDFADAQIPFGLHRIKMGGLTLRYDDDIKRVESEVSANARHINDFNETETTSTTYLTSGDTHRRSRSQNHNTTSSVDWNDNIQKSWQDAYISIYPLTGGLTRTKGRGSSLSATFNADPLDSYRLASLDSLFMPQGSQRLENIRINTVQDITQSVNKSGYLHSGGYTSFRSPFFGNNINVGFDWSYNFSRPENFQHYTLDNRAAANREIQNVYSLTPSSTHSINAIANYTLQLAKDLTLSLGYNFGHNRDKNNNARYRLDSIPGWDDFDRHLIGSLPSARELLGALDVPNSYHRATTVTRHNPSANLYTSLAKGLRMDLSLRSAFEHHTIADTRPAPGQRKKANLAAFTPDIAFSYDKISDGKFSNVRISYNRSEMLPSMVHMLDLTDNTNPLFVSMGNAHLKNTVRNNVSLHGVYSSSKHSQSYFGYLYWSQATNDVASATTYDRATGVTTYRPQNINGNWSTNSVFGLDRFVDKKDRLKFSEQLSGRYNHNVDYTTDSGEGTGQPLRSVVHNTTLSNNLKLKYSYKTYNVEFGSEVTWNLQNSKRQGFSNVSAVEYQYGIKSNGPIIWGINYETNFNIFSRRGYSDPDMNDDRAIWNLKLSYAMLKQKQLTFMFEAHDLLGQLSNVRTVLNAQGRTETWHNAVPRYVLFHMIYRFNSMNKPKAENPKG